MKDNCRTHNQYRPLSEAEGLLSGYLQQSGVLKLILLVLFVFTANVAHTQADTLFDFQMKLAKKGNAEAQYKVGEMYETGFGVEENMVEAENWIKKAAGQGHETAEFKLLYWNVRDNGITPDTQADVNKLRMLATAGNPQAQYYMGMMYAHGAGLKKDLNKGMEWLSKAALVGVLEAERERELLQEAHKKSKAKKQRKREQEKKQRKARALAEREKKQKKIENQKKLDEERKISELKKQKDSEITKNKLPKETNKKNVGANKKEAAPAPVAKEVKVKKPPAVTKPEPGVRATDDEPGDESNISTKELTKEEKEAMKRERQKRHEALLKAREKRERKRNTKNASSP